jgi:hypothetical protein
VPVAIRFGGSAGPRPSSSLSCSVTWAVPAPARRLAAAGGCLHPVSSHRAGLRPALPCCRAGRGRCRDTPQPAQPADLTKPAAGPVVSQRPVTYRLRSDSPILRPLTSPWWRPLLFLDVFDGRTLRNTTHGLVAPLRRQGGCLRVDGRCLRTVSAPTVRSAPQPVTIQPAGAAFHRRDPGFQSADARPIAEQDTGLSLGHARTSQQPGREDR